MKIHILRPDSITPIALYIKRQRDSPESYRASRAALLGQIQRDELETERALSRTIDAFDERVRQLALRVRKHVEGDAFTRFLSTEAAFCEQERDAALRTLVP